MVIITSICYFTALILFSCTNEDVFKLCEKNDIDVASNLIAERAITVEKGTSTFKDVSNYIHFREKELLGSRSNHEGNVYPIPYVIDKDTVAWIINHSKGWELLSNDRRTSLVIARSDEGEFPLEHVNDNYNAYLREILRQLSELKKIDVSGRDKLHPDWTRYYLPNEKVDPNDIIHRKLETRLPISPSGDEDDYGYWQLVSYEKTDSTTQQQMGPTITTSWKQEMNSYIPDNKLVGCAGVAGAQYLYHLFLRNGYPTTLVDYGTYNPNTGHYVFSGNSGLIWSNIWNENYRDLLLGYVAESIGTQFGYSSSSAVPTYLISFLNNFGYWICERPFMSSNILSGLNSNGAILCTCFNSNTSAGHMLIIDGYIIKAYHIRMVYGWVPTDGNGNPLYELTDPYDEDSYDDLIIREEDVVDRNLFMNWGYGTNDNYILFNISGPWDLPYAGNNYDSNFKIYY
ncbi:MAG: C10 family peptidase [Bacteroidaceae bacterium]|nr:C10 family peptidase [Bacteroidaceae bacterium]